MEDEVAVAPETPVEESAPDFAEASEAALEAHPGESGEAEVKTESEPAGEDAPKADTEEGHLAWVKSVSGNVNEDGSINVDRVTKQAHELHKQSQKQTQALSRLEDAFAHPDIAAAFKKVYMGGEPPVEEKPAEVVKENQTNEEILGDFVNKTTKPVIDEMQGALDFLMNQALQSEYGRVQGLLETEFPNYGDIKDDVGALFDSISVKAGTTSDKLLAQLARDGSLHATLKSAAINVLYPGLKEAKAKTEEASKVAGEEKQKRARLGLPTGSASRVDKATSPAASFQEAMEQAEEELAAAS